MNLPENLPVPQYAIDWALAEPGRVLGGLCPDCDSDAEVLLREGRPVIAMHHDPTCPAYLAAGSPNDDPRDQA